ncbi:Frataxin-like domain-containing protein [Pavlovales sp. CCMP2436]|nr:Frataxin-like domain-containing protein [Pavlovales sp. CCMP2436]|mmetsp:Transcript_12360/g.31235  ORF Transcript_12360/g.31235 Transcript_12360/m.31235 type:complete len:160 (-) Transcript_12360:399-878(-)
MLARALRLSSSSKALQTGGRTLHRAFASGPPEPRVSELEVHRYQAAASRTLECLQETLEKFIDEADDESDVDFSGDVLNLTLDGHGTFVLNKQGPNKQIWLSSPVSGPLRYDLDVEDLDWVSTRDRCSLGTTLSRDIKQLTGRRIDFNVKSAISQALRA